MHRACTPEILDSLPPGDPEAVRSRRDLRKINSVMGNARWLAGRLRALRRPGDRVLEIGAGTGEMGSALARECGPLDGLDLLSRPPCWPREAAWHTGDLCAFGDYGAYDLVVGNLIFHHLGDTALGALGQRLRSGPRVIVACEPHRSRLPRRMMAVLGPAFGASPVTLHDARVSIEAGFRANELPALLGLEPSDWDISTASSLMGAYRMVAARRS